MLHNKLTVLNLVKSAMITLLILSCLSFVGCGKTNKDKTDEGTTDKVVTLIQWLKDKDRSVRQMAAEQLGERKEVRAVAPLITALKDNNRTVRQSAAEALGEIKDARSIEPLVVALKDNHKSVRWSAAGALGEIGSPAVESLISELKAVTVESDNMQRQRWER